MKKSMNEIKEYVKKRDEVLNKFNVKAFTQWVSVTNPKMLAHIFFFNGGAKAETVLLATMCKMCIASTGTSEEVKDKARKELDRLGMSYE